MNRAGLIKLIKTGQRYMKWDDATYRAWLEKHTGCRSCTKCSEVQLVHLANELRELGFAMPASAKVHGGRGPGRPTQYQWSKAEKLAQTIGFQGLEDPGLAVFTRRVAKVDSPRFLDYRGISALIIGLEKWAEYKRTHHEKGGADSTRRPE